MSYPAAVDLFTAKTDGVDTVLANDVNALQTSVVNVETALGLNPQGSAADLAARLLVAHNADGTLKSAAIPLPLPANSVNTAAIQAAAVGTTQIAALAITTGLIAAAAVGTAQMAAGAVTTALIANQAVGTGQIANLAVTAAQVANNTIAAGQVTSGLSLGMALFETSFETGEQVTHELWFPFPVTVTLVRYQVTHAIAGTDAATLTFQNAAGNLGGGFTLTLPASTAVGTEGDSGAITTPNTIAAGTQFKAIAAKTTPGGRCRLSVEYTRTG